MNIDFGTLTAEQTISVFRAALEEISFDDLVAALKAGLDPSDLVELVMQLDESE